MTSFLVEDSSESKSVLPIGSLEEALRTVEPGAVLVPRWLLQNIAAVDEGAGKSHIGSNERQLHVISRQRLLMIADKKGLALPVELPAVDTIALLARPDSDWLSARSSGEVLRHYWRLLFHQRIAAELRRNLGLASGDQTAVQTRIERIGRIAFNEARFVLQREGWLAGGAGDGEAYAEFAAVYLELNQFRPDLLKVYFPAIEDPAAVLAGLSPEVDADELLRRTRVPGAAGPRSQDASAAGAHEAAPLAPVSRTSADAKAAGASALAAQQAERAAFMGNIVRAAILRERGTAPAPGQTISDAAAKDLGRFIDRLRAALDLDAAAAEQWRASLTHVLAFAADGWWNQEARLLYDLQKVCVNHERELYSVGVIEWLLELGRRPLRRPQPRQRIVLICKALHSALSRIPRIRISARQGEELSHLLHHALHENEAHLRDALRPAIAESLKAGDLIPHNATERVAEDKLVDELLDGLTHRGFITLSNLRDAVSNNQIKFKDIAGPVTFFRGDPLFKIDRRLCDSLDGVYHRGEIYLRLFQRVSSLFFATLIGRFLTRTILMPLLGSFIIIVGLDHTVLAITRLLTGWEWLKLEPYEHFWDHWQPPAVYTSIFGRFIEHLRELADPSLRAPHLSLIGHFQQHIREHTLGKLLVENVPFELLALFLLGVINSAKVRAVVARGLKGVGHGLKLLFYTGPRWLLDRAGVQEFLNSRATRFAMRYLIKPLAFAVVAWVLVRRFTEPRTQAFVTLAVFAVMNLLLNNPAGRTVEQAFFHWLRAFGARLTSDIFGNVLSGILHFFGRRMEDFDRMLYAVDEWLRFRAGQPRSSLYVKATLGVFWFYIAYVSRFALNLLVEPQVNPVKHFPVVTVSHKIILPQVKLVAAGLTNLGISAEKAKALALPVVFTIPGIFGFLAWELRSNWQLYRANRSKTLKPVQVGSHGESMARLLRPGFHSGTVPKIFARVRKAHRQAGHHGDTAAAKAAILKQEEALEHVSEAVAHFIERELLALLNQHPLWSATPVSLTGVTLFPTRITIELACPALGTIPARIFFEQRRGWILAEINQSGWTDAMPPAQAQLFSAALLGIYKLAGVDVVKEQVENLFAPQSVAFELYENELTAWPDRRFDNPLTFNLLDKPDSAPKTGQIDPRRLLLSAIPIEWEQWVAVWDPSANGSVNATKLAPVCVLATQVGEGTAPSGVVASATMD